MEIAIRLDRIARSPSSSHAHTKSMRISDDRFENAYAG